MKYYLAILLSWFLFAFWGVVSRSFDLAIPVLVLLVAISGFLLTLVVSQSKFVLWNSSAFVVSIFLVFDLCLLLIAFRYAQFATVITLHYLGPVLILFLSPYVVNEKPKYADFVLVILGFLGVVILFSHEMQVSNDNTRVIGLTAALLSALTLAGNVLFQRRYMKKQDDYVMAVRQYNLYMCIESLLILIPLYLILVPDQSLSDIFQSLSLVKVVNVLIAGAIIQGGAMLLFNASARFIPAKTLAKLSYSEVIWVSLFGLLLYEEQLQLFQLIGMTIILLLAYFSINRSV